MVPYPPYDDDTMTVSNGDAASTVLCGPQLERRRANGNRDM